MTIIGWYENLFSANSTAVNSCSGLAHTNFSPASTYYSFIYELSIFRADFNALAIILRGSSIYGGIHDKICINLAAIEVDGSYPSSPEITKRIIEISRVYGQESHELSKVFLRRFSTLNLAEITSIFKLILRSGRQEQRLYYDLFALHVIRNVAIINLPQGIFKAVSEKLLIDYQESDHIVREIQKYATDNGVEFQKSLVATCVTRSKLYSQNTGKDYFCGHGLYAFGHMLNAVEALLRLLHSNANCSVEIRLCPSMFANSALGLLIAKLAYHDPRVLISASDHDFVASYLQSRPQINQLEASSTLFNLRMQCSDTMRNLSSYLSPLEIDGHIWTELATLLSDNLYAHKRPYVTLYARDNGFKKEPKGLHLNSDRNCEPARMVPIIKMLIDFGFDVIRIGDSSQEAIPYVHPRYFEYSRSKFKSDLNDIYIASRASFCVVCGFGGASSLGDLFGKRTLLIDFPLVRRGYYNPLAVAIPLKYYKNDLELDIYELLRLTPGGVFNARTLKDMSIDWLPAQIPSVLNSIEKALSWLSSDSSQLVPCKGARHTLVDSKLMASECSSQAQQFWISLI